MGFNTAVVILNDELHKIEHDKDFGLNLARAIQKAAGVAYGERVEIYGYQSHVVVTGHADTHQIVEVHGNLGTVMKAPHIKLKPVIGENSKTLCAECGYSYGKHREDDLRCPANFDDHGWNHGWLSTSFKKKVKS